MERPGWLPPKNWQATTLIWGRDLQNGDNPSAATLVAHSARRYERLSYTVKIADPPYGDDWSTALQAKKRRSAGRG